MMRVRSLRGIKKRRDLPYCEITITITVPFTITITVPLFSDITLLREE